MAEGTRTTACAKSSRFACAEGSTCAEPTPQGIWTCLRYGNEGDPCSGPYDRCNLGLECKSAVCTPVASRGFFTTACMP